MPVEQMKAVLTWSLSKTSNLRAKLQSIAGNHTYNQPSNMHATYCPTQGKNTMAKFNVSQASTFLSASKHTKSGLSALTLELARF